MATATEAPLVDPGRVVLSTREQARELLEANQGLDPTNAVYLKADLVEVACPSYLDELIKAWPGLLLEDASPEVWESFQIVWEHRR